MWKKSVASGDYVVDRDVGGDVGQDAGEAERVALVAGADLAGQLDVHVAGDQLGLGQFEDEGQLGVHGGLLLRSCFVRVGRNSYVRSSLRSEERRVGKEGRPWVPGRCGKKV